MFDLVNDAITNLANPATTSAITVITGVFVIVVGQIFIKFFIEPIQKQYEQIGKITDSIIFYKDLWELFDEDYLLGTIEI